MPARISVLQRIILDIAVAIERLRIGRSALIRRLPPRLVVKLEAEPVLLREGVLRPDPRREPGSWKSTVSGVKATAAS